MSEPGELAVNFEVSDPGAYIVTLVVSERRILSEGAHGTEAQILPFAAGPWQLWVGGSTSALGRRVPPASEILLP